MRANLNGSSIVVAGALLFSTNETARRNAEVERQLNEAPEHMDINGYVLPRLMLEGTSYETTVTNTPACGLCCANIKEQDRQSVVEYWSHMNARLWWTEMTWDGFGPLEWPWNLMLKWIVGPTETTKFDMYTNGIPSNYTLMYYTEVPDTQILSCMPLIEATEASVTVAHDSGQVLEYAILKTPETILEPWTSRHELVGMEGNT